jgi:DNA-binding GntR family transcriptional regulator
MPTCQRLSPRVELATTGLQDHALNEVGRAILNRELRVGRVLRMGQVLRMEELHGRDGVSYPVVREAGNGGENPGRKWIGVRD